MSIAGNVSAVEFRDKNFVEGVQTILWKTGLEARYLQLGPICRPRAVRKGKATSSAVPCLLHNSPTYFKWASQKLPPIEG